MFGILWSGDPPGTWGTAMGAARSVGAHMLVPRVRVKRSELSALVLSLVVVAGLLVAGATPTEAADVGPVSATV